MASLACEGKVLGGEIVFVARADTSSEKLVDRPIKAFGTAIFSLFGSKWLAIVVTILALLVSAFMSLGVFEFGNDEDWEWPNVLIFINALFVCFLFLAGLIVTVIY